MLTVLQPCVASQTYAAQFSTIIVAAFTSWRGHGSTGWYRMEVDGDIIRTVNDLPDVGDVYVKQTPLTHVYGAGAAEQI